MNIKKSRMTVLAGTNGEGKSTITKRMGNEIGEIIYCELEEIFMFLLKKLYGQSILTWILILLFLPAGSYTLLVLREPFGIYVLLIGLMIILSVEYLIKKRGV